MIGDRYAVADAKARVPPRATQSVSRGFWRGSSLAARLGPGFLQEALLITGHRLPITDHYLMTITVPPDPSVSTSDKT